MSEDNDRRDADSNARPRLIERAVRAGILVAARISRPLLMGVRGVVVDGAGGILLVRHTYVRGWHLPGGGVEIGETLDRALERELAEEANVMPTGPTSLHGVFFNPKLGNRDHVAVFVVRHYRSTGPRKPDREIAESAFFARDALPDGTTRSVRERLAEIFDARPVSPIW